MLTELNVAIVEDQQIDFDVLNNFLLKYASENEVSINIKRFENGQKFINTYTPEYDIVFMDIEMPEKDGLATSEALRKIDSEVMLVFITNLVQFAIKGYAVSAFDFICKPISYSQLSTLMGKAMEKLKFKKRKEIIINTNRVSFKVDVRSILYIEVVNHTLIYHVNDAIYNSWGSLTKLYNELQNFGFVRVNKSMILNLRYVQQVDGLEIQISNGDKLYLSRSEKKNFYELFSKYVIGE